MGKCPNRFIFHYALIYHLQCEIFGKIISSSSQSQRSSLEHQAVHPQQAENSQLQLRPDAGVAMGHVKMVPHGPSQDYQRKARCSSKHFKLSWGQLCQGRRKLNQFDKIIKLKLNSCTFHKMSWSRVKRIKSLKQSTKYL